MHGPTLITGISGFTGRHLAARLCAAEEVVGLGLSATTDVEVSRYVACDLTDAARVREVIDEVAPARVYHLACCPSTAPVERLQSVIVDGFRNLAAALQRSAVAMGRRVRMLTVGSAAELGFSGTQKLPAGEHAPCEPTSDYGRAKLAVTRLVCEARPT
ncbi:MAG: NAD-dependent epimerase/dehydratase family protein, partial [Planctomycetes bacterium]|nr:NAD-dependent epimerase/dehydratase family protein [Planctomycetota bacterium]